jgi:hypothetical protein
MVGPADILVRIDGPDLTDAELAELSRLLGDELLALPVDDVRPAAEGPPPPGAKAVEAVALGALIVSAVPQLIGGLVDVVVSWLKRQPMEVSVEIDGQRFSGTVTRAQRDALVERFLERTAAGPSAP